MRHELVLAISLLTAAPALALDTSKLGQAGTLTLDDRADLVAKSPKLKSEVEAAMAKLNQKYEDVHCTAMRFPGVWDEIGGTRVSPYVCQFGDKWLLLRTKVRVLDKRGKVIEGMNKDAQRRAVKVDETGLVWTWSDQEPKLR